ncbi:hypothetical protein DY124_07200 [Apilactobacillus micheneri]|uniref:lectin-like domain-containing protein n=1 Tax=Apilactobacillus micheneri TaxID=1899430 RepID=UPI00112E6F0F|nr:hypothetical protein [Apilactobacillus micheneri]TPR42846.1 hypothetical protein DY124_07200 [Apilactobacillus micheneri]TPR47170.1 hypothetical protein DY125_07130 [Apilactobacillus micheneri]
MTKKHIIMFITLLTPLFLLYLFNLSIYADNNDSSLSQIVVPPPEHGPAMQGNFHTNGYNPPQVYNKYPNVQVITDNTTATSQSMWWKNKLNIYKPFTIKFYAYIKPNTDPNSSIQNQVNQIANAADGITFTLQNDTSHENDDGNVPINSTALGAAGEDLGVYGNSREEGNYGGINNAFSYEFDQYLNGDYIDNGLKDKYGNVIRNIVPRFRNIDSKQYIISQLEKSNPSGAHTAFTDTQDVKRISYAKYAQVHYNALPLTNWPEFVGGLLNPQQVSPWHKVIYNWTPHDDGTGTADVTIDDNQAAEQSHTIDISNILGTTPTSPYVWWGFTGATGANSMFSAIAHTAVTGDPGITKTVTDLNKLSDKDEIKENINNSSENQNTKNDLIKCLDNPNSSSSNSDLSNKLLKYIPEKDFSSSVSGANLGDVILYKVDVYNYTKDGQGNSWTNVKVNDDNLSSIGMQSLDGDDSINATYQSIPPISITDDKNNKPSSVGIRTIVTKVDGISNPRVNTVTASGSNFYGESISGINADRSSEAKVNVDNDNPTNPRIYITNELQDTNKKGSAFSNELTNVEDNDTINYKANLKNIVSDSNSPSGEYQFWVPSLSKVNNIKIDGNSIGSTKDNNNPYYDISDGSDNSNKPENYDSNSRLITIHNLGNISGNNTKTIDAQVKLGENDNKTFSSTPVLNTNGNSYLGQLDKYNFKLGSISFKYIKNIDYGTLSNYKIINSIRPFNVYGNNSNNVVNEKSSYNIAQIHDNRPNKTPYSVYLSQNFTGNSNDNVNIIGTQESPFLLTYFNKGSFHDINSSNDPVKIYSKNNNFGRNDYDNIDWNDNNELRLSSNRNNKSIKSYVPGVKDYNANLVWNIKNAP